MEVKKPIIKVGDDACDSASVGSARPAHPLISSRYGGLKSRVSSPSRLAAHASHARVDGASAKVPGASQARRRQVDATARQASDVEVWLATEWYPARAKPLSAGQE